MANVEKHFFEGTEKLLEIWFSSTNSKLDDNLTDLRRINRKQWENLLEYVQCQVLSVKQDADMVAYVLSESSMFVSKKRFILKTCGKTTLLRAIKPLLQLVKDECGMDKVDDIFYSRKKFEKPELQHEIHQNFDVEVAFFDELFDNGSAYVLGRLNAECCNNRDVLSWIDKKPVLVAYLSTSPIIIARYLYTLDNIGVLEPDQTLELLMQDLDEEIMKIFTKDYCKTSSDATKLSGIKDLIPGTLIDDYIFDPCGYSMNGILPGGEYFTIHITPEPHCSYVSFEANVAKDSYHDLIVKVLSVFKPGKFILTLFANEASVAEHQYKTLEGFNNFRGFRRTDHQFCQFKNYNLTYSHFTRGMSRSSTSSQ